MTNTAKSFKYRLLTAVLILLSLLATIKICILGLGIDEEYAVTMAYRMTVGDRMFLEMWEPHQTSGFLTALLIRIFQVFSEEMDYLVIYLRIAGAIIQAGISIFLYRTLKRRFSSGVSFVSAVFFYNTLPKWIQTPEFANMLTWFSVLAFICFLRYYLSERPCRIWLAAAGACLAGLVLSYPSCILAIPVYLAAMWMISRKTFLKDMAVLLGTCGLLAVIYIGYFLSHMTLGQFLNGLGQMMTDGSHSFTPAERLAAYGQELLTLLPHGAAVLLISCAFYLPFRKWLSRPGSFSLLLLSSAALEQVVIWLTDIPAFHFPLLYFYILFALGITAYHRLRRQADFSAEAAAVPPRKDSDGHFLSIRTLFWLGSICGGAVWLSALLITNTTISVTGSYLMTGLISGLLLLDRLSEPHRRPAAALPLVTALCLLGATLFAKGYMVCEVQGMKSNIFYVKQKALEGPAKGIYCRYLDGYDYNNYMELIEEYVPPGVNVLYVGHHSLRYLPGSQIISAFSTISTPTFDQRLLLYWKERPEKYPEIVICDSQDTYLPQVRMLLALEGPVAELEGIEIYLVKEKSSP